MIDIPNFSINDMIDYNSNYRTLVLTNKRNTSKEISQPEGHGGLCVRALCKMLSKINLKTFMLKQLRIMPHLLYNRETKMLETCRDSEFINCGFCGLTNIMPNHATFKGCDLRCAICSSNLHYTYEQQYDVILITYLVIEPTWHVAGDLDKLMKTLNVDSFDDWPKELQEQLIQHDTNIVKNVIKQLWRKYCCIGNNIDEINMRQLKQMFPQIMFKTSSNYNSVSQVIPYYQAVLQEQIGDIAVEQNIFSMYSIVPLHTQKVHYSNSYFHVTSRPQACYENCTHKLNRNIILLQQQCLQLSIEALVQQVINSTWNRIVILRQNKYVRYMQREDGVSLYLLEGENVVHYINGQTYTILTQFTHAIINDEQYQIRHISRDQMCDVYSIQKVLSIQPDYNINVYGSDNTINMPLPFFKSDWSPILPMSVKMQSVTIDRNLLNVLLNRNITGDVSWNELRQYAVGFALTRYVIHNTLISSGVDYDIIDVHILLCKLIMYRHSSAWLYNRNLQYYIQMAPYLQELVLSATSEIVKYVISTFYEMMQHYMNVEHIFKLIKDNQLMNQFVNTVSTYDWDNILHQECRINLVETRVYQYKIQVTLPNVCQHIINYNDQVNTNKICHCCKLHNALDNDYCQSCSPQQDVEQQEQQQEQVHNEEIKIQDKVLTQYDQQNLTGIEFFNMFNDEQYVSKWSQSNVQKLIMQPIGNFMIAKQGINVIGARLQQQTTSNSCGWDCFNTIGNYNLSQQNIIDMIGVSEELTQDHIIELSNQLHQNVIIELPSLLYVNTFSADEYLYIQYQQKATCTHWQSMDFQQVSRLDIYYCIDPSKTRYICDNEEARYLLRGQDNYQYELDVQLKTVRTINQYKLNITKLSGLHYLSNNTQQLNNIRNGEIHMLIKEQYLPLLNIMTGDSIQGLTSNLMQKINIRIDAIADLNGYMLNSLRLIIMQYLKHKSSMDNGQYDVGALRYSTTTYKHYGQYIYIQLPKKVKTFDYVTIKCNTQYGKFQQAVQVNNTVYEQGQMYMVMKDMQPQGKMQLITYKVSAGSLVRQVCNVIQFDYRQYKLSELLTKIIAINGLPGTGKTTRAAEIVNTGVPAVCQTNGAKMQLRSKVKIKDQVQTLEHSTMSMPEGNKIVVDEAQMMDVCDIIHILILYKVVYIFGDTYQIGKIDMYQHYGEVEDYCIYDYLQSDQVTTLTHNYRYGGQLLHILQQLVGGVSSELDKQQLQGTEFTHITMDRHNLQEILKLYKRYNANMLLVYYQDVKQLYLDKVSVETIHSYQGQECDVVVILQYSMHSYGICGNAKFMVSALTRARKHVILITVLQGAIEYNILDTLNMRASGPLGIEHYDNLNDKYPYNRLKLFIIVPLDNELTFHFIQQDGQLRQLQELPTINPNYIGCIKDIDELKSYPYNTTMIDLWQRDQLIHYDNKYYLNNTISINDHNHHFDNVSYNLFYDRPQENQMYVTFSFSNNNIQTTWSVLDDTHQELVFFNGDTTVVVDENIFNFQVLPFDIVMSHNMNKKTLYRYLKPLNNFKQYDIQTCEGQAVQNQIYKNVILKSELQELQMVEPYEPLVQTQRKEYYNNGYVNDQYILRPNYVNQVQLILESIPSNIRLPSITPDNALLQEKRYITYNNIYVLCMIFIHKLENLYLNMQGLVKSRVVKESSSVQHFQNHIQFLGHKLPHAYEHMDCIGTVTDNSFKQYLVLLSYSILGSVIPFYIDGVMYNIIINGSCGCAATFGIVVNDKIMLLTTSRTQVEQLYIDTNVSYARHDFIFQLILSLQGQQNSLQKYIPVGNVTTIMHMISRLIINEKSTSYQRRAEYEHVSPQCTRILSTGYNQMQIYRQDNGDFEVKYKHSMCTTIKEEQLYQYICDNHNTLMLDCAYSTFIIMIQQVQKKVLGNDRIDGLLMGITSHTNKKTKVYQHIVEAGAQQVIQSKGDNNVLYLGDKCYQNYAQLIQQSYSTLAINTMDILSTNSDITQLIHGYIMLNCCNNHKNFKTSLLIYNPLMVYIYNQYHLNIVSIDQDDSKYQLYNDQLQKLNWYVDSMKLINKQSVINLNIDAAGFNDRLVVDYYALQYDNLQLQQLYNKYKEVYLCLPIKTKQNMTYQIIDDVYFPNHHDYGYKISTDMVKLLNQGYNCDNDYTYILQLQSTILDHGIYYLKIVEYKQIDRVIIHDNIISNMVQIKLPWFSVQKAIAGQAPIQMQTFNIQRRLFRQLMMRMYVDSSNYNELLAYGRKMLETYNVDVNKVQNKHNINTLDFVSTVNVAYYHYHNMQNVMMQLQYVVNHLGEIPLVDNLLMDIFQNIMKVFSQTTDYLHQHVDLKNIINQIMKKQLKMDLNYDHTVVKYCLEWYPSSVIHQQLDNLDAKVYAEGPQNYEQQDHNSLAIKEFIAAKDLTKYSNIYQQLHEQLHNNIQYATEYTNVIHKLRQGSLDLQQYDEDFVLQFIEDNKQWICEFYINRQLNTFENNIPNTITIDRYEYNEYISINKLFAVFDKIKDIVFNCYYIDNNGRIQLQGTLLDLIDHNVCDKESQLNLATYYKAYDTSRNANKQLMCNLAINKYNQTKNTTISNLSRIARMLVLRTKKIHCNNLFILAALPVQIEQYKIGIGKDDMILDISEQFIPIIEKFELYSIKYEEILQNIYKLHAACQHIINLVEDYKYNTLYIQESCFILFTGIFNHINIISNYPIHLKNNNQQYVLYNSLSKQLQLLVSKSNPQTAMNLIFQQYFPQLNIDISYSLPQCITSWDASFPQSKLLGGTPIHNVQQDDDSTNVAVYLNYIDERMTKLMLDNPQFQFIVQSNSTVKYRQNITKMDNNAHYKIRMLVIDQCDLLLFGLSNNYNTRLYVAKNAVINQFICSMLISSKHQSIELDNSNMNSIIKMNLQMKYDVFNMQQRSNTNRFNNYEFSYMYCTKPVLVQLGTYNVDFQLGNQLYQQTDDNCVQQAFDYISKEHNRNTILCTTLKKLYNITNCDVYSCISVILSLGVNVEIQTYLGHSMLINAWHTNSTYQLHITDERLNDHVQLHQYDNKNTKMIQHQIYSDKLQLKMINQQLTNMCIRAQQDTQFMSNQQQSLFDKRYTNGSILALLQQGASFIQFVDFKQYSDYVVLNNKKIPEGRAIKLLCQGYYFNTFTIDYNDNTVLPVPANHHFTGILIDVRFSVLQQSVVKKLSNNAKYIFTQSKMDANTLQQNGVICSVVPNDFQRLKYDLYIVDFDNRLHDKYDIRQVIEQANFVKFFYPQYNMDKLKDILQHFNKQINRQVIHDGTLYYLTEFDNENTARILSVVLGGLKSEHNIHYGNNIYNKNSYNPATVANMNKLFKHSKTNKYITQPQYNGPLKLFTLVGGECQCMLLIQYVMEKISQIDLEIVPTSSKFIPDLLNASFMQTNEYTNILIGHTNTQQVALHRINSNETFLVMFKAGAIDKPIYYKDEDKFRTLSNQQYQNVNTDNQFVASKELQDVQLFQRQNQLEFYVDHFNYIDEPFIMAAQAMCNSGVDKEMTGYGNDIPIDVLRFFNNHDLFDNLDINIGNYATVQSTEHAMHYIKNEYFKLARYPIKARVVLTKLSFAMTNTLTNRVFRINNFRRYTPNANVILSNIMKLYFRPDYNIIIHKFRNNKVQITKEKVELWLKTHHSSDSKQHQLLQWLNQQVTNKPITGLKMHMKEETLTKDSPIKDYSEQSARAIMWQPYYIAALFAPVFNELKCRIKELFSNKLVYVDGMTIQQINAHLSQFKNIKCIVENDLEKQDRQTDKAILEVEYMMYELLGMDQETLELYKQLHEFWILRSSMCKAIWRYMRHSGESTTALGNMITDLQVHIELIKRFQDNWVVTYILGDDNQSFFDEIISVKDYQKFTQQQFNINCKISLSTVTGVFCHYVLYKIGDIWQYGPDLVRLSYKFQLFNSTGSYKQFNEINMRIMSYLMIIGKNRHTDDIQQKRQIKVETESYYDQQLLMNSLCYLYGLNEYEVQDIIQDMYNSMLDPVLYKQEYHAWTSDRYHYR